MATTLYQCSLVGGSLFVCYRLGLLDISWYINSNSAAAHQRLLEQARARWLSVHPYVFTLKYMVYLLEVKLTAHSSYRFDPQQLSLQIGYQG